MYKNAFLKAVLSSSAVFFNIFKAFFVIFYVIKIRALGVSVCVCGVWCGGVVCVCQEASKTIKRLEFTIAFSSKAKLT